jgi:NAD(P)-dependent dehydrogenase (short-subunit alcohol dehydrogenase family)
MSRCFVTGATGFLGSRLVEGLIQQGHDLVLLLRLPDSSRSKYLIAQWQQQIEALDNDASCDIWQGDICQDGLGLTEQQRLTGFEHVYHLAANYDLAASNDLVLETNVQGTENLFVRLKEDAFSGQVHVLSSIAIAGDYKGRFSEDMFDEGQQHEHVYHLSKFQSEACARRYRDEFCMDVKIYRPGAVVGDSKTGETDKIDGPYYMFLLVSFLKRWLPAWAPLVIPKLDATIDIVPQDYVIDALILLSQSIDTGEQYCFHLTDPNSPSLCDVFKNIIKVADGPQIAASLPLDKLSKYGFGVKQLGMIKQLKAIQLTLDKVFERLGIPSSVFHALMPSVQFSADQTQGLLRQEGLVVPPFTSYVERLWDYYNRNLDPAKNRDQSAVQRLKGKVVLITGGSSGIGFASAKRALAYGAKVILVARHEEVLLACKQTLLAEVGGDVEQIHIYTCDISKLDECDQLVAWVNKNFGTVDILFSNAGRSIRRSLSKSEDRFHDLERTMQLNYFGAARLILGLLPSMVANGGGHILHSSSMGTMAVTPRFGPYMASKSALDALCDSIAAEYADRNICATSIKFPLVKTSMVAPTSEYKEAELVSPDAAADMFINAVIDRPRKQVTKLGVFLGSLSLYTPDLVTQIYNYLYQIWPDEKGEFPDMLMDRALLTGFIPHSPL